MLVTKIGLDGHDRGSRVVAAFLRDAGMDVLYTPPWQEIGQVVRLAEEEDVDVIGISSLATDHLLVPKLMKALKKAGLEHIPVVVGGIVPDEDERKLKKAGVRHVFHPGASREEIVSKVAELAERGAGRQGQRGAGVRREELPGDTASFRREWNLAFALVAVAAALLFAAGHTVAGAIAIALARRRRSLPGGAPCASRTAVSTAKTSVPAELQGDAARRKCMTKRAKRASAAKPCRCRCPTSPRRAGAGGRRCRRGSAARRIRRTAPASR